MRSISAQTILELGCFTGITTAWLALALEDMGGGEIYAVDCDADRCRETEARVTALGLSSVTLHLIALDAIAAIHTLPPLSIDFAFIDDKIDARHMRAEMEALWSWYDPAATQRMSLGGLIAVHDVTHDDVASAVIGHQGYILNTVPMHAHGGLALIQIPSR